MCYGFLFANGFFFPGIERGIGKTLRWLELKPLYFTKYEVFQAPTRFDANGGRTVDNVARWCQFESCLAMEFSFDIYLVPNFTTIQRTTP